MNLRQRAEKTLRADITSVERDATTETPSFDETQRLLHELQVHKIELEMQNDELNLSLAEMREHKERLANIVKYTPAGYFCIDPDGRFIEVNDAWLRMFGYNSPEEVIGRHFSIIQVDSTFDEAQKHLAKLLSGEAIPSGEFSCRRKDGSIGYHTFSAHPVVHADRIVRLEWFLIDISERRKHELYLDISREVLQLLNESENMPDSLYLVIALLKFRMKFDAVGIRLQEGDDFPYQAQDGFPRDFLLKENSLVERAVDGGVCRDKDGGVSLECICGLVISGKSGTSQLLLTKGGSFWSNDTCPLLELPHDEDPRTNPRNECIHLGYASVALVPVRVKERIVGLIQFNDRHKGRFTPDSVELLEAIASNIGSTLMRKQLEDEKMLLEHQFQQAQKLESLGILAGGIAHDFNNILAIILGHCGLMEMDAEEAESHIPMIKTAVERAAVLCRQMLDYAGMSQHNQTQINLVELVDEMVNLLKATIPQNVVIKRNLSAGIPLILGDESQIRQIVMNLIINASEAIGKVLGEIAVSLATSAIMAGQSEVDHLGNLISPGQYACLEVTDNGCGMDDETRRRIFEPFYTTKFTGRGLGMSAIMGIIIAHKGAIQLFTQPGEGTTFKVYLPMQTEKTAGKEPLTQSDTSLSWLGSGTILLVEDEEQIRSIAKILLKKFGFTVLEATNGKEALELYQKHAADVILVMTDMGMPVMDGYALISELNKINSGLPIIISSGFGDAVVASRVNTDEIAGLIYKPYSPGQLRKVLKSVVGSTDACSQKVFSPSLDGRGSGA
ncbi:MAG: response regulator [Desulfuromonadales bacterium]